MKQGYDTGQLGRWLEEQFAKEIALRPYQFYYDHGESSSPHVGAVKGFFGNKISNANRLADVDFAVVEPNGEAVLLVEIEERKSQPKKLLGDVFALLMCNRVAFGQQNFALLPTTKILVAGVIEPKGSKREQLQVIQQRLNAFVSPENGVPIQNVEFLFEEDISTTIERVKEYILELLVPKGE